MESAPRLEEFADRDLLALGHPRRRVLEETHQKVRNLAGGGGARFRPAGFPLRAEELDGHPDTEEKQNGETAATIRVAGAAGAIADDRLEHLGRVDGASDDSRAPDSRAGVIRS